MLTPITLVHCKYFLFLFCWFKSGVVFSEETYRKRDEKRKIAVSRLDSSARRKKMIHMGTDMAATSLIMFIMPTDSKIAR